MNEIEITEEDMRLAEEIAKKRRKVARDIGLSPRFQTDALQNEIIGLVGEIKFAQYIGTNPHFLIGCGDAFDFKIGGKIIEIKTRQIHNNITIIYYPKIQFRPNKFDYLVIIRIIDRKKAVFLGFIKYNELANYEITTHSEYGNLLPTPSIKIPFSDIIPIERLMEHIKGRLDVNKWRDLR